MKITHFHIAFILLAFSLSNMLNAQEDFESRFEKATMEVYERPDNAIKLATELFETAETSRRKVSLNLLIATAYSSKRDYENSMKYALKAKKMSEDSGDILSQLKVLSKIAAQYHQMSVNDKALQYLDEFDKKLVSYQYTDSVRLIQGNNYGLRGFIYRDKLNCDIAIRYFDNAIKQFNLEKSAMMRANTSVILYNKGNCFISLNNLDSAQANFMKSIKAAENANAKSLQAFSQKGLAEVYTLRGDYSRSLTELETARQVSKNVGDLVLNQGIFKAMANNYLAMNNWDDFQVFYEKYMKTEKRIRKEERSSISVSLDTYREETNRKLAESGTQYIIIISVLGVAILLVLLSIFIGQRKFSRRFKSVKSRLRVHSSD